MGAIWVAVGIGIGAGVKGEELAVVHVTSLLKKLSQSFVLIFSIQKCIGLVNVEILIHRKTKSFIELSQSATKKTLEFSTIL
jgi:hypothetical protein